MGKVDEVAAQDVRDALAVALEKLCFALRDVLAQPPLHGADLYVDRLGDVARLSSRSEILLEQREDLGKIAEDNGAAIREKLAEVFQREEAVAGAQLEDDGRCCAIREEGARRGEASLCSDGGGRRWRCEV